MDTPPSSRPLHAYSKEELIALVRELEASVPAATPSQIDSVKARMYDEFFEFLPIPAFETDVNGILTRANARALAQFGYEAAEVVGRCHFSAMLDPSDYDTMIREFNNRKEGIPSGGNQYTAVDKSGNRFEVLIFSDGIFEDGAFRGVRGVIIDISERLRLENALRRAQRLESIGRMAAGVAHDFNNLLGPIIGYSEMLLERVKDDPVLAADVREILSAATSAKEIGEQLLSLGSQPVGPAEPVDLCALVQKQYPVLRRIIPEDIAFLLSINSAEAWIQCVAGEIKQVLLNLVVNAHEACGLRGTISLEVGQRHLDAPAVGYPDEVPPGHYAYVRIGDTGSGMAPKVLQTAFDPFYTTHTDRPGKGLGLSIVWTAVQHHHGFIQVDSTENQGTSVAIYFPLVSERAQADAEQRRSWPQAPGPLRVLAVDDSPRVCRLLQRLLERAGFDVLTATSADDAIQCAAQHRFDIALLDVVMPDKDGATLAAELTDMNPDLRVVFMSGYADADIALRGVPQGTRILQKPFDARALHEILIADGQGGVISAPGGS